MNRSLWIALAASTLTGLSGINLATHAVQPKNNSVSGQSKDWASPAIQSLIHRYGCTVYSSSLYPWHTATREDLAAALKTCLEQVGDHLTKEDRVTAQLLQTEFKTELSVFKANKGSFDARTATLEAQQFSNSTKSMGEVVYGVLPFSDVKPTDWAYQSLKLLVERYSCLVGSPSIFGPHRAATRVELAMGLNACLGKIGDRITSAEDLKIAQSLQTEFKPELATLRDRANLLKAQSEMIAGKQFSATTKIQGQAVITFQSGF